MARKTRKKPDWTPVEAAEPGRPEEEIGIGTPIPPENIERWLDDGGRPLEGDLRAPGEGKSALADALGHTEWRPAEVPPQNREAPAFPGSGFLDALFLDFPFPAGKREVACHLAEDAALHAGPAETFHDLVIRLDSDGFKDIHELKRALGGQFAQASAHNPGGRHDG